MNYTINPNVSCNGVDLLPSIDGINELIANQANLVRSKFESSQKKKRKLDSSSAAIFNQQSDRLRKARPFHSRIAYLSRTETKNKTSHAIGGKSLQVPVASVPKSAPRTSDGIVLNSKPNEIHLTYNDIVCGRGKMTNNLVGNQRYRVWIDLHHQAFTKSLSVEDQRAVAHSIVNTVKGSSPSGRFLSLDMHSGEWYDVGYERAVSTTMAALADGALKALPIPASPPPMPEVYARRTLVSRAA